MIRIKVFFPDLARGSKLDTHRAAEIKWEESGEVHCSFQF